MPARTRTCSSRRPPPVPAPSLRLSLKVRVGDRRGEEFAVMDEPRLMRARREDVVPGVGQVDPDRAVRGRRRSPGYEERKRPGELRNVGGRDDELGPLEPAVVDVGPDDGIP